MKKPAVRAFLSMFAGWNNQGVTVTLMFL